jgi:hypothetical protein
MKPCGTLRVMGSLGAAGGRARIHLPILAVTGQALSESHTVSDKQMSPISFRYGAISFSHGDHNSYGASEASAAHVVVKDVAILHLVGDETQHHQFAG